MKSSPRKTANDNPFLELTWMDIQEWAGSKILSRGKSYQRSGCVKDLSITGKNELVAWVEGSTRYATKASCVHGKLSSTCTCPYGSDCKHGVALVIDYLESVKQGKEIPIVPQSDERITMIDEGRTSWPRDCDDDWDEQHTIADEESGDIMSASQDDLEALIKGKSKAELAAILSELAQNHPQVKNELQFKLKMSSSSVSSLARTISREIDRASKEPGWYNSWEHSGFIPNYSRVRAGLQKLFDAGNFDEIIKLGKELFSKGMEQAGQSDDEGETIEEISTSLDIVYQALISCSLSDVDKMEQAINWELADDYSVSEGLEHFWVKKFDKKTWSTLADRLLNRLKNAQYERGKADFNRNYNRNKLTDQIINALDHAGRSEEILELCIQEAPLTGSYQRLVSMLRKSGENIKAEEWIRKGIRATYEKFPGIASQLRKQLLEIHTAKQDWLFSAAIKTDEFFEQPSVGAYTELKKYCEKANVWHEIRPFLILFLNSGQRPKRPAWLLPDTGIAPPEQRFPSPRQFADLLIEIALLEKDIEEALRLYDDGLRRQKEQSTWRYGWGNSMDAQIANAVKDSHPDRSIAIWKRIAESHIARTSPKEYAIAIGYLNKIQKVLTKNGRENEFRAYLAAIRAQNIRKIRLVEMLDSMSGKRIVDE